MTDRDLMMRYQMALESIRAIYAASSPSAAQLAAIAKEALTKND